MPKANCLGLPRLVSADKVADCLISLEISLPSVLCCPSLSRAADLQLSLLQRRMTQHRKNSTKKVQCKCLNQLSNIEFEKYQLYYFCPWL